jgi:cytochrome P450
MTQPAFSKVAAYEHDTSRKRSRRQPPRPPLYRLPQIMYRLIYDTLRFLPETRARYGDVVFVPTLFGPFYLVTHPDGVRRVLQENHQNYDKNVPDYHLVRLVLGNGLLTNDGASWLQQRRLIQPAFHRQRVAGLGRVMTESALGWLERLEASGAVERGTPVDIAHDMADVALSIAGKALFGDDLGGETSRVGRALTTANNLVGKSLYQPWVIFLPTPQRRRLDAARRELLAIVDELIAKRRQSRQSHDDLLQMLLDARDEETGAGMDAQQLRDEVLTLLLAGHETTANVLTWTFLLLAQRPDVEAKSAEEYRRVLDGRPPAIEDLPNLPYNRMVIEEVMRLYPPAWGFGRRAVGDDEIGGYAIPRGAYVSVFPYLTHRHPDFWERPDEFIPERFSAESAAGRPRYAYFPFGGGPRLCIGNQFALYEAQLVLATILPRYRLRLAPGTVVAPEPLVTLRPHAAPLMTVHRAEERKQSTV